MDCKELAKGLSNLENRIKSISKLKLKISYTKEYGDYNIENLLNPITIKEINIPNYYEKISQIFTSKQYTRGSHTHKLNCILWIFLLSADKSKSDLKILDKAIDIFNTTTNTLISIKDSEPVRGYLKAKGFDTYQELYKYFYDEYGIDIDEYQQARIHNFKIKINNGEENNPLDPHEEIYRSNQSQNIIIDSVRKHKDHIFDDEGNMNYLLFYKEIKKKVIYPRYVINYGYPLLNILKSNKVSWEFSSLDTQEEIIKQLFEIFKREKHYKRNLFSSEKDQFLEQMFYAEEYSIFNSIGILEKAAIIYPYEKYCKAYEKHNKTFKAAKRIYNFHVFLSTKKEEKEHHIFATSKDFITDNTMKDIRKQINSVSRLLKLQNL